MTKVFDNAQHHLGWRYDLEDFDSLHAGLTSVHQLRALKSVKWDAPDEIDCRQWHRIENQNPMGSCQGSSLSSVVEYAHKIATGDPNLQLSKFWLYRQSQIKDGINGDEGSTLDAGRWVVQNLGACLESIVPYPRQYKRTIENLEQATVDAKQRLIRKSVDIHNYDDAFDFLSKGLGGVQIGIAWPSAWFNPATPYLDRYPGGSGGHALAILGYTKETATDGSKWLIMPNTWGTDWCDKGFAYVSKKCFNEFARHRFFQAIGHTDLSVLKPRRPSFGIVE